MLEHDETTLNNKNRTKIAQFLEQNHFIVDNFDFDKEVERFVHELELGLKGDGVLPMIPTYIDGDLHAVEGEKVITVDIGGSNLRLAVVEIVENKTIVSNVYKSKLPGIDQEIDFATFIDVLANRMMPYLEYSNVISFSFAHQVEHNCELDGFVIELSKELHIEGIKGKLLADSLKKSLLDYGYKSIQVVLINDTVGVAYSMMQESAKFSSCIGVVMGTGVNSTYAEDCKKINKISDANSDSMFINIESGDYIPSFVSEFDREYIETTQNPNAAVMEKMVSGRYLGNLFHFIIKKGCEYKLFSEQFVRNIYKYENIDTQEMSKFYSDINADCIYARACETQRDIETLYFMCKKLICRAAYLIAVQIIAISKKTVKKDDKPICCIVEGTTYFRLKGFGQMVKSIVDRNSKELDIKIYSVKNAALKGIGNIGISMIK